MKAKSKNALRIVGLCLCLVLIATVFTALATNKVAYAAENKTLLNAKEYILQNMDRSIVNDITMEGADLIDISNILTDASLLPTPKEGQTLASTLYDDGENAKAFIVLNESFGVMYNTDDLSDYYVALVNPMIGSNHTQVKEYVFAYSDIYGNVIDDVIYDENTGLAYIPKRYTAENKNGQGILNVQVQLIQALDPDYMTTSFNVIVNKADNIEGEVVTTGIVDYKAVDTQVDIKVAQDFTARQSINAEDIKVKLNGEDFDGGVTYNSASGYISLDVYPTGVFSIEISLDKENHSNMIDTYKEYNVTTFSNASSKEASYTKIKIDGDPNAAIGCYTYVNGIRLRYRDGEGNVTINCNNAYVTGVTDDSMRALVKTVMNGGSINKLYKATVYNSWRLSVTDDIVINMNGCNITIPQSEWDIKCCEGGTSFGTLTSSTGFIGDTIGVRVFEVNTAEHWILLGVVTPKARTQAGASLFKLEYEESAGNIAVVKTDNHGNRKDGAYMHMWGPDFDQYFWTNTNEVRFDGVKPGTYYLQEVTAPGNMIKNYGTATAEVQAGQTATIWFSNTYQRGATTLTKYDANHRGATLGDSKLNGAVYNLYAATDIWEGATRIYAQDQLVATNIVTKADGSTDAVGDLPIGSYYYVEQSPSEGFNLNSNRIPVQVTYAGQDSGNANTGYCECPESQILGNIAITKRLQESDYDAEINLEGARFKATLNSNHDQVYYSNYSGTDGLCVISSLPYGTYTVEECDVPASALKAPNYEVYISEHSKTYENTIVDTSKKMKGAVQKHIVVDDGEATDATVEGAVFTVYKDAACQIPYIDKNGNVVTIGPTDANGYAESLNMWTGEYYLKETTFPIGIDPDAMVTGENVTYRDKVYNISIANTSQSTEYNSITQDVDNKPNRNKIEIIKKIGETSNTPVFPIDQCEFTVTLKSTIGTDHVFSRKCTAETDRNTGYCVIENLPYGEYVVEETKVSPITLKCSNFDIFVEKDVKVKPAAYVPADATKWYGTNPLDSEGSIIDTPKVMQIKIRKMDANRTESDPLDYMQGDANLFGAIYQIYRYDPMTDDYTEFVYEITTNHYDDDGYVSAESRDLLVGNYMVKEKIKYSETLEDGTVANYSYAEGYLTDPNTYYFTQKPEEQLVERTYQNDISKEEVIRGDVRVIKYDNKNNTTTDVPSAGAILRLTLDSNPKMYYTAVVDSYGRAQFIEEKSNAQYYPYTIPYGKYTISEEKESNPKEHTSWFLQAEDVVIKYQKELQYRIEADMDVMAYPEIQKRDADNNAKVALTGAKFKIWDIEHKDWVKQIVYPSGAIIDTFTVDKNGLLTAPDKISAGKYVVYEVEAPAGYFLQTEWRIPENAADLGNPEKGGKLISITKQGLKVAENTEANTIDLFYNVPMEDEPLKGKLEIIKTGEVLTDAKATAVKYGEEYTPVYKTQGLKGVTYNIVAADDIKSPDGFNTYVFKGEVVDTITTDESGIAVTDDLYLGEYEIKEVVTPVGYITDTNIPNVTLTNTDTLTRVKTTTKELTNVRQKLALTFMKKFDDINFSNSETLEQWAVFGVFANEDIKNVNGVTVIAKGDLVETIKVTADQPNVNSVKDLPCAKYIVKEIDVAYPYELSQETREFTLAYNGNTEPVVMQLGETMDNTYDSASVMLVKVSASNMNNIVFNGDEMDKTELDAKVNEIVSEMRGLTKEEVEKYVTESGIKCVAGAEYTMYLDKDCTKPLYIKNESGKFVEAKLVTDEHGIVELDKLPLGTYYLKETKAPVGYQLSKDIVEVTLTIMDKGSMIYNALVDEAISGELIKKTDIFTGEVIPNCTFEIATAPESEDEEPVILMHATTDAKGIAYIPTDIFKHGEKYTYTEIKAPEMYDIDTRPHLFTASFDENGNWNAELLEVSNLRKKSTVKLIKTDDQGNMVPNCTFELMSEETGYYEKGTTDEDGIYVFEEVPYGNYTYTELEAPEEYILDTEPHDIVIDSENMDIKVTNVLAPDTGDIAVYAIIAVAVVCVAGIAFVLYRKFKK